jgi:bifunctional N-acetylglucosamine-1-phosphate-uridyltransferase/glucosamine-1-phosphate-acetyltransferase GlmU-like protein
LILKYIEQINNDNNQKEYYLTDLPKLISKEEKIDLVYTLNENEIMGVNTKEQLDYLDSLFLEDS